MYGERQQERAKAGQERHSNNGCCLLEMIVRVVLLYLSLFGSFKLSGSSFNSSASLTLVRICFFYWDWEAVLSFNTSE